MVVDVYMVVVVHLGVKMVDEVEVLDEIDADLRQITIDDVLEVLDYADTDDEVVEVERVIDEYELVVGVVDIHLVQQPQIIDDEGVELVLVALSDVNE